MPDRHNPKSRDTHELWVKTALERHEQRLVRFAVRLLGEEDAARDVVQHAFLQLCRQPPAKAEELGTGESVVRWLFCVVRRRAYDLFRKEERRGHASNEYVEDLVSDADGPDFQLEQKELGELLLTLVDSLPHAQRESVLLWAEGYSSKEIADIADRQHSTVRVHLHKAFKSLREHPSVRKLQEPEQSVNGTSLDGIV